MQRSDILLSVATFVFGFGAGVYVYFAMYEPNFRLNFFTTTTPETTFSVTGDAYGPCEDTTLGCRSFRLLSNREYRLISIDAAGVVRNSREGLLSNSILQDFVRELNRVHQQDTLERYPQQRLQCRESFGGVLYTIEVTSIGRYYLDVCSAAVSEDDRLYQVLERMAHYFELRDE